MVRQRPRKTVEELYAPKYESTNPLKNLGGNSGSGHTGVAPKTVRRSSEQDYSGGYIITSTAATFNNNSSVAAGVGVNMGPPTGGTGMTTRRKTARNAPTQPPSSSMKYSSNAKDDKAHLESMKKEQLHHHGGGMKTKTTARVTGSGGVEKVITTTPYDAKHYVNYVEPKQLSGVGSGTMHGHKHPHQHHGNHHNQQHHMTMMQQQAMMEHQKDDETEEFFNLIRETVDTAIGKTFSHLFSRSFRDLSSRVDALATEIQNTNKVLQHVQAEMIKQIKHYGEETSGHYRYLCMKSEYDKMFYQHQMMVNQPNKNCKVSPTEDTAMAFDARTGSKSTRKSCANNSKELHKSSSDERAPSQRSSEVGMRQMIEQIQRFCNQINPNDVKANDEATTSALAAAAAAAVKGTTVLAKDEDIAMKPSCSSYHTVCSMDHPQQNRHKSAHRPRQRSRLQETMKINKRVYDADDDDDDDDDDDEVDVFEMSSYKLSPRTDDDEDDEPMKNYPGGMTMRGPANTTRLNGGGDS